jgi:hypothetical protein
MNSEFQIIRWGIPGWIFFMTIFIFKLTTVSYDVVALLNSFTNPAVVAGFAAFFAALGVPLGYVLYQVYYGLKWRTIRTNTLSLAIKDIPDIDSLLSKKSGLELWYTIEGYFDSLMSVQSYGKKISYKDLVRRYNSFSNRTSRIHGLGASSLAMVSGFILFVITTEDRAVLLNNNLFLLTMVAFLVCLGAVWFNYQKQNKYSFVQLNKIMIDIINAEEEEEEKAGKQSDTKGGEGKEKGEDGEEEESGVKQ